MSLWERLGEVMKQFLTLETKLDHQSEKLASLEREAQSFRAEQRASLSALQREISALSERVARLETSRDADRREVQAILVQIQTAASHVEFLTKQLPPSPTEP